MRPSLALAAALAVAAGAASAQTDPADLIGQTVYATGGTTFTDRTGSDGSGSDDTGSAGIESAGTGVSEASPDWTAIGRVAGVATLDGAPVALLELEGIDADVPVMLDQLQLVADADDPGVVFVLSQIDARTLASQAEEIERDRLAELAAAEGELFKQSPAMDGEPADGADAGAEGADATVVVVDPEAEAAPQGVEVAQAQPDAPREVDIADPDAPPIEDAENVVPESDPGQARVPELAAETELRSPSHTAATPIEPGEADVEAVRPGGAPEDFAPVDMATMDPAELLNVRVYTVDDENIGQIDRWVGEAPGRMPEAAVVNVGGFLGLGSRDVAIGTDMMTLLADADGNDLRMYVDLTREQLEELPELTE